MLEVRAVALAPIPIDRRACGLHGLIVQGSAPSGRNAEAIN